MARRLSLLWILACCLLLSVSRETMQAPVTTAPPSVVVKTTEPEVAAVTNTTTTTTTTTVVTEAEPGADGTGVGSIAKNNNYTNYALHDQKLLVNGNLDTSQLPRNIATSSSAQTSGGISITLMAVLLVVITLIISIILTAVFVMRRRFSIWRVNGDRMSTGGRGNDDGAKGALTKSTTSSENTSTAEVPTADAAMLESKMENEKTLTSTSQEPTLTNNESKKSIECEKKMDDEETKQVLASCIAELNSVENPQPEVLVCVTNEPSSAETVTTKVTTDVVEQKPPTTTETEVKTDITSGSNDQQPSPATSETRLIAAETEAETETPAVFQEPPVEQTTTTVVGKSASTVSLSSSAVNPVSPIPSTNDLNPTTAAAEVIATDNTETTAAKMASKSASASKSALNDEEKEPLTQQ